MVSARGLYTTLIVGADYAVPCKISNEREEETEVMRKLSIIVTALCVCTAFAVVASAQEKTLCERLGGPPAISAVVDSFAGKVLKDDRINKKFAKSDANRLVTNLKGQIGAVAKCPGVTYKGKNMKNAHRNMGVTEGEFKALAEDLVKTLDEFKVPEKEKGELLAAIGPLQKDIVEKPGDMTTGTDLPANFKPSPPLKTKVSAKQM
jgi:hemoglobin